MEVIEAEGVGSVVHYLADIATKIGELPIEVALRRSSEAHALADHLSRCKATIADADRGVRALDGFALLAQATVGEALAGLEGGKPGPHVKSPRREAADAAKISRTDAARLVELAGIEPEERSRIASSMEEGGRRLTVRGVLSVAKSTSMHPDHASAEWYTPEEFIRLVAKVGGGHIDTDLTSCLVGQWRVKARRWYSLRNPNDEAEQEAARRSGMPQAAIQEACAVWGGLGGVEGTRTRKIDGRRLTQAAVGHVFGQPDYGDPGPTIRTIIDAYNGGKGLCSSAIVLLNVATSSSAQQELMAISAARLWIGKGEDHPRTRIAFISPAGVPIDSNNKDQVGYYLGPKATTFAAVFGGWGVVKIG